jgi:hypothetical protein
MVIPLSSSRAELLDDANELIAGRERRPRHAEIRADAEHRVGVRHRGRQHPHANLAGTGSGNLVLDHLQHLGATVVVDHDALHRLLFC